jgi:hypothetical protein
LTVSNECAHDHGVLRVKVWMRYNYVSGLRLLESFGPSIHRSHSYLRVKRIKQYNKPYIGLTKIYFKTNLYQRHHSSYELFHNALLNTLCRRDYSLFLQTRDHSEEKKRLHFN